MTFNYYFAKTDTNKRKSLVKLNHVSVLIVIFIPIFSVQLAHVWFYFTPSAKYLNIVFRCAIQHLFSLRVGLPLSTRAAMAREKYNSLGALRTRHLPAGSLRLCWRVTRKEAFSH